ncbi:hypothetical protein MLD38_035899 [Melastoma candidum]|uniref:Uncharacterized protein n=1 Tax=Melastoma candidum TaxID=119954 RepID=A0ACB9LIE7_9MYRT|nr:hypothetical protein MLD38_035899 [Melastoma candidum]
MYSGANPLSAIISLNGAPRFMAVEMMVTLCSLILAANVPVPTLKSKPIRSSSGLIFKTSLMRKSTGMEALEVPTLVIVPPHISAVWEFPQGLINWIRLLITLRCLRQAAPPWQWITAIDHEALCYIPVIVAE